MRLLTTPTLDFIGQGGYENMLRRTRVLFLLDEDFTAQRRQECGALSRLMNELRLFEHERMGLPADPSTRDRASRNRGDDTLTRLRAAQIEYRSLDSEAIDCARHREGECEDGLHPCRGVSDADRERYRRIVANRDALLEAVVGGPPEPILRIDLIAHSMGAIVANELISRHGDLFFENVVYMAAASSIKDFSALALPYLRANPTTRFHVLTLYPENDATEANFAYLVPRGSLLEWIDGFITNSKSELDFTLGRWNNIIRALPLIDYLESEERERLRITGFGRRPGQPLKHGHFDDAPKSQPKEGEYPGARFWESGFWKGEIQR